MYIFRPADGIVLEIEEAVPSASSNPMPPLAVGADMMEDVQPPPMPPWMNPAFGNLFNENDVLVRNMIEDISRASRAHAAACEAMEEYYKLRIQQIKK